MSSGPNSIPAALLAGTADGPARRGACPTLHVPMQTGDGLLARLRIVGGRLTQAELSTLAMLAERHGNGLLEITARGNLQVRGLRPESAPIFARTVSAQIPIEGGLNIDLSPLAGDDPTELADPRPLADAIRKGAEKLAGRLAPKVSVVIDGSGQVCLAALKADIRLVALPTGGWTITLGGSKPQRVDAEGATATALAVLGALAAIGPEARATDLFPYAGGSELFAKPWRSSFNLAQGKARAIALPFGSARSSEIMALCEAAKAAEVQNLRLAPDHTLLLDNAPDDLIVKAEALGFITASEDARWRISACIGSAGCASGHIPAREMAAALARELPSGKHLHVSGCSKGCAHPRPADLTLVGRPDGIGLVINGRAGDTPRQVLDADAVLAGGIPFQDGQ